MYAVIETGGKQYKVAKNDVFLVEKLNGKTGAEIELNKVLLAKDGDALLIGTPYIKSAKVLCQIIDEVRAPKVTAYKYKRRKSEKKKIGHRQDMTKLKVTDIEISKG